MTPLVLALLAQTLNLNMQPIEVRDEGVRQGTTRAYAINCSGAGVTCTNSAGVMTLTSSGGGGGAPTTATYITQTPDGTLSGEQAMSLSGSGLVLNTTGTGVLSIYAGATCGANQYATQTSSAGALTCSQVAYSQLTGAPTIPTDVSGASYWTKVSEANLSNEMAMGTLGTGLIINTTTTGVPTIKGANTCTNQFPRSDNASGTWTCASIATADLPTVPVTKGGTNLTTIAANQVWTGTAADTVAAKTVPSCSNGTTDKLLYDNATQTWSCGTDQTSAGGGYATVQDEGTGLTARTTLNFTGAGVSCADDTTRTTCTISGGGGGGVSPYLLAFGAF